MPREGYIAHLRSFVGTQPLFMPSVAVLVRDGHGRRLAELARVEGLDAATGDYRLTPLTTPQTGDLP